MEIEKYIEKFNTIEEQITLSIDLLEIAKSYCDCNFDKASEVSTLGAIIGIVLKEQKNLASNFDGIM